MISFKTCFAISRSLSVSSRVRKNASASVMERSVTSAMDFPFTFTASTFSLSLLPPHFGQGRTRMNFSSSRRRYSDWVWW